MVTGIIRRWISIFSPKSSWAHESLSSMEEKNPCVVDAPWFWSGSVMVWGHNLHTGETDLVVIRGKLNAQKYHDDTLIGGKEMQTRGWWMLLDSKVGQWWVRPSFAQWRNRSCCHSRETECSKVPWWYSGSGTSPRMEQSSLSINLMIYPLKCNAVITSRDDHTKYWLQREKFQHPLYQLNQRPSKRLFNWNAKVFGDEYWID